MNLIFPLMTIKLGDINFGESIKDFFSQIWQWIYDNIIGPLGGSIRDALGEIIVGIKNTLMAMFSAITMPFKMLGQAWVVSYYRLSSVLGPFSFLTPLIYALMAVAGAMIIYYAIKWILPGEQ